MAGEESRPPGSSLCGLSNIRSEQRDSELRAGPSRRESDHLAESSARHRDDWGGRKQPVGIPSALTFYGSVVPLSRDCRAGQCSAQPRWRSLGPRQNSTARANLSQQALRAPIPHRPCDPVPDTKQNRRVRRFRPGHLGGAALVADVLASPRAGPSLSLVASHRSASCCCPCTTRNSQCDSLNQPN